MDIFQPKVCKSIDPILEVKSQAKICVPQGGSEYTYRAYTTQSHNESSTQWNVPPPNPATIIDRRIILDMPLRITATITLGASAANNTLEGFSALPVTFRQFPISSIIKTLSITINGCTITCPVNDIIKPLMLFSGNRKEIHKRTSGTAAMRDWTQDYDMIPALGDKNPTNYYFNSGGNESYAHSRSSYIYSTDMVNNAAGNTVQDIQILGNFHEELFLDPLIFGGDLEEGFLGVQSLEINITWDTDKLRAVSGISNGVTMTSSTGNKAITAINAVGCQISGLGTEPKILFKYCSLPYGMSVPRSLQYPFMYYDRYFTSVTETVAYGYPGTQVQSPTVKLNAIPKYLFIWMQKKKNDGNSYMNPDSYCEIEKIEVNWNNRSSLLSSALPYQLWQISSKNGCILPWKEWSGHSLGPLTANHMNINANRNVLNHIHGLGSVVCLEMGTDISLMPGEFAGLIGQYNLNVRVNWKNISKSHAFAANPYAAAVAHANWELCLMAATPGVFTIYDNAASQRIGILPQSFAKASLENYSSAEGLIVGGKKKGFRKFLKTLSKIGKIAEPVAQALPIPGLAYGIDTATERIDNVLNQTKGKKNGLKKMAKKYAKQQMNNFMSQYAVPHPSEIPPSYNAPPMPQPSVSPLPQPNMQPSLYTGEGYGGIPTGGMNINFRKELNELKRVVNSVKNKGKRRVNKVAKKIVKETGGKRKRGRPKKKN